MPRKRTERPSPYRDTFFRIDGLKQEQQLHFRHKNRVFPVPFPSYPGAGIGTSKEYTANVTL